MKKSLLTIIYLLFIIPTVFSQINLAKQWDHTFGGSDVDILTSFMQTADSGFLLGGYIKSDISGEVTEALRGITDYWIVKTDAMGVKQWDKRFGGDLQERLLSFDQTDNGDYVLGGFTGSDSTFDVSQHTRGSVDYWLVRTDGSGNKLWDRRYGGNGLDNLSSIQQTDDGGFILGGWTFSDSSGEVSDTSRGGEDFWLVKTDGSGNLVWDKRYGGNGNDELFYLQQTFDGGYILGGRTASDSSGEVTHPPRGDNDYWIVKTDALGNKLWDKRFGGAGRDNFLSLQQTFDHGYVLGGFTKSDIGGDVTEVSRDTSTAIILDRGDIWIVKTDSVGTKQWDKRFGGHWVEDAFGYVRQTLDSNYLWGSASYSNMSGDKSENNFGYEQSWIVKIDTSGNKIWDKTIFVDGEDEYAYPLEINDSCFVVANWSYGDSAGFKTEDSRGGYDYWIIKFCESVIPQLPVANFSASTTTSCAGGCYTFINSSYNAGSFKWLFPGATPDSSTNGFPENICYPDSGSFDVTLIAYNLNGSDTLVMPGYIHIIALQPFTISQNADTLFAPQGQSNYQWFLGITPLVNDTLYYYVITATGTYAVQFDDSNGCPNSDSLFAVFDGINSYSLPLSEIILYPNPAKDGINVFGLEKVTGGDLRIFDVIGREVYSTKISSSELQIQISNLNAGIYILQASNEQRNFVVRFVKE